MGILARIKSALTTGKRSIRHTNRGVPFSLDKLEFVDKTGQIVGCDYEYAATALSRRFAGSVIPKELASLFDDYCSNPCLKTALDLILFDAEFLVYFVNNKRDKELRERPNMPP